VLAYLVPGVSRTLRRGPERAKKESKES
jgi:hypothetical protein